MRKEKGWNGFRKFSPLLTYVCAWSGTQLCASQRALAEYVMCVQSSLCSVILQQWFFPPLQQSLLRRFKDSTSYKIKYIISVCQFKPFYPPLWPGCCATCCPLTPVLPPLFHSCPSTRAIASPTTWALCHVPITVSSFQLNIHFSLTWQLSVNFPPYI